VETYGIRREEGQVGGHSLGAGQGGKKFPKCQRLRRTEDIQQVLRHGRRLSQGGIQVLALLKPGQTVARAGFVVRRKLGGACLRNLMKRRMREAYRELKCRVVPSRDLVISATSVIGYKEVRRSLEELLDRGGAIEGREEGQ